MADRQHPADKGHPKDERKTKKQLIAELVEMRQRLAELEVFETGRAQAEERAKHLNAVLRAIRSVNQLIVRERDRDRLLQDVCENLIETRGYHNVWIALLDEEGGLVETAEAGLGEEFLPLVERLERGELTACGRRALEQPGVVATQDPPSACTDCPLSAQYAGRGAMTVRLEHGGKVYGLASVSIPAHLAADEEEMGLFKEVAGDIALALNSVELEEARARAEEARARAEEALWESERRYRALFERSNDSVFIFGLDGIYIAVNQRGADMLGYGIDELIGKGAEHTIVPDQRQDAAQKMETLLAEQSMPLYERTFLTREGTPVPAEINLTLVRDAKGRPVCVQSIARDVTERVRSEEERARAEEALRESEEKYRTLVTNIPAVTWITDRDGNTVFISPNIEKVYGFTPEEICRAGDNLWFGRIHPDDVERVIEAYEALFAKDGGFEVEYRIQRKDGCWIHAHDKAITTYEKEGMMYGYGVLEDVTERVRAEEERARAQEALRESEELYRGLFNSVPVGLYRSTPGGQILDVNPAFIEMIGYPDRESLLAANAVDMQVNAGDRQRWQAQMECEGIVRGYEAQMRRHDGTVIWIQDTARVVRDTDGQVLRYEGSIEDITERVHSEEERARAQEALEQRAAQLALLNDIGDKIAAVLELDVVLDRAAHLVQENFDYHHVALFTLDREREELVMRARAGDFAHLFPLDHRLKLGQGVVGWVGRHGESLLANDVDAEPRYVNLYPDVVPTRSELCVPIRLSGDVVGVLDAQSPHRDAFNENDVMVMQSLADQIAVAIENARLYGAVRQELADRERAEGALRESEEKYRTILQSIEDGYYEVDLAGNLVFFNDSLCGILGYSPDELMGLNNREFMDEETARLVYQAFNEVYRTGKPAKAIDWELVRKDGDRRLVETNVSLIRDPTGEPTGYRGIARDVTERVRSQEERARIEKQLRQQERLAAVGQLAGGIAHDFNNLLTTILLYAQMPMSQPGLPPVVERAFETIVSETRRAAELVRQILDFSRRSPIETRPLNLQSFIKEATRMLERTIPASITLQFDIEPGEYVVNADSTRIQQVVLNLALNAQDTMPEGGELRFGLSRVIVGPEDTPPVAGLEPGEWVCLAVSDTGAGIPPEVLPHVFEPFFTTKEAGRGTGLGLAQVHGIVGQHGGYIEVETEMGADCGQSGGTTFRIYLPAYGGEVEQVTEEGSNSPRGRGEIILLVEDEENVREAGRGILESLGYRMMVAADGREALDVYGSAGTVDLVITDIVMPEMGGRTLMRELKKADPHLRVLAITGYALVGDLEVLKEEGFLNVVQKPFDIDDLARAARQALDEEIEQ